MKIRLCLVFLVLSLIFSLSGCQDEVKPSVEEVDKEEPQAIVIKAVESDPRTNEYPTKLSEFSFDFDSDNEEEKIELYTAASRTEDGKMAWDDGQNWLLVAIDKNKYFQLFSGYVQLGQVYYSISTVGEENASQVSVYVATNTSMEITDYVFNKEKGAFEGTTAYSSKPINQYFTSIPNY